MSKLKVVKQSDILWGNWFTEYYLKSEADKVIAELKEKAEHDCAHWKMQFENSKTSLGETEEACLQYNLERNHSNYKRCLAMARIAQDDWHLHNSFYAMGHQEFEKRKCDFYDKWHRRWLEIAEKFKPNPTINRKGGANAL